MRAIYSIEGNIGSGKSTFLNLLKAQVPSIHVIPQPVAEWQKISDKFNLLEEYYRDPHRWAFTFQINAVVSRAKQLKKLFQLMENQKNANKIFFSQRSIIADRQIFAKLLHQENKMNQMQYLLYLNLFNSLDKLFKVPRVHKFIYLRSSPQKCMERMVRRARFQQNSIPLDYLTKIHNLHQCWLGKQKNVFLVEGEEQFENSPIRAQQMLKSVKNFIQL